jgi:hypothetical protein
MTKIQLKTLYLYSIDGDYLFDPFMALTMDVIGMIYLKPLLLV